MNFLLGASLEAISTLNLPKIYLSHIQFWSDKTYPVAIMAPDGTLLPQIEHYGTDGPQRP